MLINFAAGGPADIEGRIFAKHLGQHIDGAPSVVVQNMDGAGGLIGAQYLGEVAAKDGTVLGALTGTAWIYASDPGALARRFPQLRVHRLQPSTTIHFVRTDVAPGMKVPDRHREGEGTDRRRPEPPTPRRTSACGSASTCSACRTNTSPAIARRRR